MCGIVGVIGLDHSPVDPIVVQKMNDAQAHRGPDGEGFLFASPDVGGFRHHRLKHTQQWKAQHLPSVGLGHRRLAIIDLTDDAVQPMSSSDGSAWIVFNGEIYNFRELKTELQAQGYNFKTQSDTEVLLRSYLHWGEDCLKRLQGMYAFAIWDSSKNLLFCARDRLGIKPFYYASTRGHFLFASEIKAIIGSRLVEPFADDTAVLGFLIHGNCDYGSRTTLRGINALPAAHSLTLDLNSGRLNLEQYWTLRPREERGFTEAERIVRLKSLLFDTTRKHLISDVQVGSCLSGGLDSSTVVGLVSQIATEEPDAATAIGDRLYTFTSCYEDQRYDERRHALAVADSVHAHPHLVFPSAKDFWDSFSTMAWHHDMPFGGLSYYAQWSVMRAARDAGVKVLLDGQGGDEVFGGYAKFRYAYLASLLRSGRLLPLVREVAATVGQRDSYVLNVRNGYRYLPKRIRMLLQTDSALKASLKIDLGSAVCLESSPASRWWRNARQKQNGHGTLMQRIQVDDILLDTLPQLLRMEDRSSMAFSLEARVPLLDHRLVEYGLSLPDNLKVRNGWSKYAVRQAILGSVPESVRLRKTKLGFAAPDRHWLTESLREPITNLLKDNLRCSRFVDVATLRRWYCSEQSRKANTESMLGLFRVLSLEMWMRAFNVN